MRTPLHPFPFALLAIVLALAACDRQSAPVEQAEPSAKTELVDGEIITDPASGLTGRLDIASRGSDAPDVDFTAPDGSVVNIADFRGRPLLINLWATWCGPCVIEMPTLDRLALREAGRLQVLTVSQDIQGSEIVDPFFAKSDFTKLEPYLDPDNNLGLAFATGLMPTTVLYDAQGKEVWRMIGGMEWDGARAAALMAETLQ